MLIVSVPSISASKVGDIVTVVETALAGIVTEVGNTLQSNPIVAVPE